MRKTRVKYWIKETNEFGIGYLYKDKNYDGGYFVKTADGKAIYSVALLSNVEKI